MRIFADKTFFALDEELTGDADSDKFARAVTYLRDDTNRAYRFYPRWPDNAGRNVEIGKLFKKVNKKPITINGRTYRDVESMCLDNELRGPRYCVSVYRKGAKYYFYANEGAEITFFDGFDTMLAPMVQQASAERDFPLLEALAADFGRLRLNLVETYRDARTAELRRAYEEYAEWKRREAAEAKRKREANARAEAACQRDHGTSCAGVGLQVLGGFLGAGIQAATGGARSSGPIDTSNFEATYELVCRERVLMDIDDFERAYPQSCKGEIWKCEESYSNALKARFGSLNKACASQFGSSYTYESIANKY